MKLRMRYIIGGALALGIAAGVWLDDWWKGLGPGGGEGSGFLSTGEGDGVRTSVVSDSLPDLGVTAETKPAHLVTSTLKVVIRDRDYYLRDGDSETPIELPDLVETVKQQPADEDGVKLRLYRSNTARVTAELTLLEALNAAGVSDAAVEKKDAAVE